MIPRHVAIIMDGNGRWAEARGRARFFGHIRGALRVREIVREAAKAGVGALTLYTFSTENWKRPEQEISILWRLLKKYLRSEIQDLSRQGVRLAVIGDRGRLPLDVRQELDRVERSLSGGSGLQLTLALSYGGRDEIVRAAQLWAAQCGRGQAKPEELTEERFQALLDTAFLSEAGDVDLLIRTGGDQRISNFLLWQCAYAELFFTDRAWPDFSVKDFCEAIASFSGRSRRFGALNATSAGATDEVSLA